MEIYILMGICLLTWGATVTLFTFIMDSRESALVFGSLGGLLLAVVTGGAYYVHLSSW
jgi:hypothetical protein